MASTVRIGGIHIDFTAGDATFQRASRRVGSALRRQKAAARNLQRQMYALNRSVRSAAGGFLSLRNIVFALAGGGVIGLVARRASKLGADLVELSWKTGITVEKLQGLQRAFESDGSAIAGTNKSLIEFLRRTSEANFGLETYARAFRILGVSIHQADGSLRDQVDLLYAVADGLAGITSQADRANAAYNIFGRAGTKMLPVLQKGSAYLKEQEDHFTELGILTTADATKLKALEQAFTDLGNVLQTASSGAIADTADVFATLVDSVVELGKNLRGQLSRAIQFVHRNFALLAEIGKLVFVAVLSYSRLAKIGAALLGVAKASGVLRAALWGVAAAGKLVGRVLLFGAVIEGLFILGGALSKIKAAIDGIGVGWQDLASVALDAIQEIYKAIVDLPETIWRAARSAYTEINNFFRELPQQIEAAIKGASVEGVKDAVGDAADALTAAGKEVVDALKSQTPISDLIFGAEAAAASRQKVRALAAASADAFTSEFQEKWEVFFGDDATPLAEPFEHFAQRSGEALADVGDQVKELGGIARTLESNFTSAFDKILFETEDFKENFKAFIRDLSRELVREAAIRPIVSAITGGLTAGLATGLAGGVGGPGNVPHPGQERYTGDSTTINVSSGLSPNAVRSAVDAALSAGGGNENSGYGRRVRGGY